MTTQNQADDRDEADDQADQAERDARVQRARWALRYVRPRTPAERTALCMQVQERVRALTPEQKAAEDLRRASALVETPAKQ